MKTKTRSLEELRDVRVGDMTRDEQLLVFRAAGAKLKRELESKSKELAKIINQ